MLGQVLIPFPSTRKHFAQSVTSLLSFCSGSIPQSLGGLTALEELRLDTNQFIGELNYSYL